MVVYIEQVLITNFIIDFCILLCISHLICKVQVKKLIAASLLGSAATLILPYSPNIILTNLLKVLTSVIMLQTMGYKKRQLVLSSLAMFVLSYIIGGVILSNFGTVASQGYVIKSVNLLYVFATTLLFTFIVCKLTKWIKAKITSSAHIIDTTLTLNHKTIRIKSFIDSGNALQDNNSPVSLINFETFSKLTQISLSEYLKGEFSSLPNPRFITASTIAGKKKILVFNINSLTINSPLPKTYENVCLGVSLNFDNTKEYKAILNSSFCFN